MSELFSLSLVTASNADAGARPGNCVADYGACETFSALTQALSSLSSSMSTNDFGALVRHISESFAREQKVVITAFGPARREGRHGDSGIFYLALSQVPSGVELEAGFLRMPGGDERSSFEALTIVSPKDAAIAVRTFAARCPYATRDQTVEQAHIRVTAVLAHIETLSSPYNLREEALARIPVGNSDDGINEAIGETSGPLPLFPTPALETALAASQSRQRRFFLRAALAPQDETMLSNADTSLRSALVKIFPSLSESLAKLEGSLRRMYENEVSDEFLPGILRDAKLRGPVEQSRDATAYLNYAKDELLRAARDRDTHRRVERCVRALQSMSLGIEQLETSAAKAFEYISTRRLGTAASEGFAEIRNTVRVLKQHLVGITRDELAEFYRPASAA